MIKIGRKKGLYIFSDLFNSRTTIKLTNDVNTTFLAKQIFYNPHVAIGLAQTISYGHIVYGTSSF
jgi:ADP-dependent phosphofructokinase/glucokinase